MEEATSVVETRSSSLTAPRWVRLNIGGTIFETTKTTLENGSEFFRGLFNSTFSSDKDEKGV